MDTNPGQDPTPEPVSTPPTVEPKVFDEAYVRELRQEAAKHRTEANQRQAELDAIKAEQTKREQEEAEKRGEFERLYRETASEADQLKTELEELRTLKANIEAERETERQALLAKLPDDIKDTFATATPTQIKVMLDKLQAAGTSPDANRQPARPTGTGANTPPDPRPGQQGWLTHALAKG